MVAQKFQSYSVKITGKYICESKNWICSFLLIYPSKTLSQILSLSPRQYELTRSSQTAFSEVYFFPRRNDGGGEGGDYGDEKIANIKPTKEVVASFDKLYHLFNLYILGVCFVVP